MLKKIATILVSVFAVFVVALVPLTPAYADPKDVLKTCSGSAVCGNDGAGLFSVIKAIIQTMLFISGIVAIIVIIVGGIRYITSNGDQARVKAAKDTILYAVVGLVVAIMAFAIVGFVMDRIK